MKVGFLLNTNVFFKSSASANRWKNIITGLSNYGVETTLIIVGGRQNKSEIDENSSFAFCKIIYLDKKIYDNLWKRRLKAYVFDNILIYYQARKLNKLFKDTDLRYLFISSSVEVINVYHLAFKIKPNSLKLFLEMNEDPEALEIHATNLLQRNKLKNQKILLHKRIFKETDCYFFMTRNLMNKYSKIIKSKNHLNYLLPMSVDFSRFDNLNKNQFDDLYIGYCGSSSFHKDGIDILIKAFEILAKNHPKIKLKIAAFMENDGKKMISLINNSESKRIEYLGELSKDEIPQFIKNAYLLVLPRPNSDQAKYGFPTKLGEYLATGNPVCCTRVGEIDDYLVDEDSVYFADAGSVDSLVNKLDIMLSNINKSQQVGMRGKQIALKFFNKDAQGEFIYQILKEKFYK